MAQDKPRIAYWLEDTLYLNITNRCSNCCFFCIRNFRRGVSGFNLKLEKDPAFEEIIAELQEVLHMRNWRGIVFCGFGEPTERLDILLDVARWIRKHYGRPVKLRVDTNGHGGWLNLGRNVAGELKMAGVDKVSVSLNAGDKQTYNEICHPIFPDAYETVLDFIVSAKAMVEVEVSAVRMPEVDLLRAADVAKELGVPFRVREYIPCFH